MNTRTLNAIAMTFMAILAGMPSYAQETGAAKSTHSDRRINPTIHLDSAVRAVGKFSNGPTVFITTATAAPSSAAIPQVIGGIQVESSGPYVIHRDLCLAGSTLYGYDLEVESMGDGKQFKVSFRPFSSHAIESLRNRKGVCAGHSGDEWVVRPIARFPEPRVLNEAEDFILEVMHDLETGIAVMDMIKVVRQKETVRMSSVARP